MLICERYCRGNLGKPVREFTIDPKDKSKISLKITVVTTPITQPDACQTVYNMAKHVGWAESELTQLVAIAYRESRCQPDAFNAKDPNGGSAGVMQINFFW